MQQLTDNNVNELFHVSMFFFYNSTKMCCGYNLHFRIYLCPSMLILVVQFSSVESCLTICDLMNCSTPDLPVHHQLPELTQTHVH